MFNKLNLVKLLLSDHFILVFLPWQNPFEQFLVSRSSPRQYLPPTDGAGFEQVRRRCWKHSGLHDDQEDQSDQPPSTPETKMKLILFGCHHKFK